MPKGNPHPIQTDAFKSKQFQPISTLPNEKLAASPLSVKVGASIYAAVMALPQAQRITWLRRVITDAAIAELLPSQQTSDRSLVEGGGSIAEVSAEMGHSVAGLDGKNQDEFS